MVEVYINIFIFISRFWFYNKYLEYRLQIEDAKRVQV